MRKASAIPLGFVLAMSAALTACEKTEVRRCVDNSNRIVNDSNCSQPVQAGARPMYFWHFGGSAGHNVGDTVHGGSRTATPGAKAITPSQRSGFGSSAHPVIGG